MTYCERDVTDRRGAGSDAQRDKGISFRVRDALPVLSQSQANYRNAPWCNGQHISSGLGTLRVRCLAGTTFFLHAYFFLPCTQFSGSACSPGQIFTWILNHRCRDMLSVLHVTVRYVRQVPMRRGHAVNFITKHARNATTYKAMGHQIRTKKPKFYQKKKEPHAGQ